MLLRSVLRVPCRSLALRRAYSDAAKGAGSESPQTKAESQQVCTAQSQPRQQQSQQHSQQQHSQQQQQQAKGNRANIIGPATSQGPQPEKPSGAKIKDLSLGTLEKEPRQNAAPAQRNRHLARSPRKEGLQAVSQDPGSAVCDGCELGGNHESHDEEHIEEVGGVGVRDMRHNYILDRENAGMIADEYGFQIEDSSEESADVFAAPEKPELLKERPPVVTIMGHVDHGKTTILDYLRKSSIVSQEFGGITQHIGAFSVTTHTCKEVGCPMIVAINKCDKPGVDIDKVLSDLSANGVDIEDYGGDTQTVRVSGKTGMNMDKLEEAVITLSEMSEFKAEPKGVPAEGWIIESQVEKGMESIDGIGNDEVKAAVISTDAGAPTDSDLDMAKTFDATIFCFNLKVPKPIAARADREKIKIVEHNVIYRLIEEVTEELSSKSRLLGARFPGYIKISSSIKVMRGDEEIFRGKLSSLKDVKENITEATKGKECGISFDKWTDFEIGDKIVAYEEIRHKRYL
ncbi:Translation initiation factor IF-2, mitochondrial [Candida viswanathii]|uniref:Translation initiation factor IF-2, mitochondrial n=1 Tax=Candida viswanathii TaxID=5486 RepID=A0A367YIH9_9ASCO|nr:Translation initiation factor IF-2, mitochondrial [Candida viswanathii]